MLEMRRFGIQKIPYMALQNRASAPMKTHVPLFIVEAAGLVILSIKATTGERCPRRKFSLWTTMR
jgi:hypothetical protein